MRTCRWGRSPASTAAGSVDGRGLGIRGLQRQPVEAPQLCFLVEEGVSLEAMRRILEALKDLMEPEMAVVRRRPDQSFVTSNGFTTEVPSLLADGSGEALELGGALGVLPWAAKRRMLVRLTVETTAPEPLKGLPQGLSVYHFHCEGESAEQLLKLVKQLEPPALRYLLKPHVLLGDASDSNCEWQVRGLESTRGVATVWGA